MVMCLPYLQITSVRYFFKYMGTTIKRGEKAQGQLRAVKRQPVSGMCSTAPQCQARHFHLSSYSHKMAAQLQALHLHSKHLQGKEVKSGANQICSFLKERENPFQKQS